jgi:mono/diheme cytochrome c family protein
MQSDIGTNRWWRGAGLGLLIAVLAACESGATNPEAAKPAGGTAVPAEVQAGEAMFIAHCAGCHGIRAVGTKQGPPLAHKIYEPNHHSDVAFQRAAESGVRAHHWEFGNMPKIEGVTAGDVDHIIRYVRWLQREAGIY